MYQYQSRGDKSQIDTNFEIDVKNFENFYTLEKFMGILTDINTINSSLEPHHFKNGKEIRDQISTTVWVGEGVGVMMV